MGVRFPKSPLVYPGGVNPGFNFGHLAAKGVRYSGVAANGGMINLLTGKPATITGTVSAALDGRIGPTARVVTSTAYMSQAAANETPTAVTFGAIVVPSATQTFGIIFDNNGNSTASAATFFYLGALTPKILANGSATVAGSSLTVGVPYFIAMSMSVANINWVTVNLASGAAVSFSGSGSFSFGTPTSSQYNIAGTSAANQDMNGAIAAVMYSINAFLNVRQLMAWGNAPWDFWYPPTVGGIMLQALKGGPASAAYSLAAASGAYALLGAAQAFPAGRSMAAAEGTYNLTGEPISLLKAHGFVGDCGRYVLTGNPQVLRQAGFGAVKGSYALAGQAATLAVGVPGAQGSYALSGKTVAFPVHLSLLAASGQYTLNGFSPSGGGGSGPPFTGRHSLEFIADVSPGMTR